MICGLGLSNEKLISTFNEAGAKVIACDGRDESGITADTMQYLKSEGIEYRLGKHYLDKLDCEILIRTPGMNFLSDTVNRARKLGIAVTSEMEIFFEFCPCEIIGVTGSDGKTTVTTIISEILKNAGRKVFVGGNIGKPLLPRIDDISPDDMVVAELSSFQLISMRRSPEIAVVTNISPNHLDVHKDMQEYIDAKKNIFLHQSAFGKSVFNHDNPITLKISGEARGRTVYFSRLERLSNGVWVNENGDIVVSENSEDKVIMNKRDIKLPGAHNLENYLAAIAAVSEYAGAGAIKKTAQEFTGVEHRMEFVRKVNGITYYNDSIATSPNRVMSGCLSLFPHKIILIAGGYDKSIPFDKLGDCVNEKVKVVILMGQTADKIEEAIKNSSLYSEKNIKILRSDSMYSSVEIANSYAERDDIIVLSPACAAFGMYKNFEERGKDFKRIVNEIGGE